jgi:RNA polymerase sigma-70 factor (ECF subfamily)
LEEKLIVEKAKAGSKAAFEQLVTAYESKVYHLALRYTGSHDDALDISQDVFLRVWRCLPRFDFRSAFSTWLYRITVNVCTDFVNKKKETLSETGDLPDIAEKRDDYSAAETRQMLSQALLKLNEDHRKIILMRDVAGLSYQEIADALGLEMGTVKSRINRARSEIREYLLADGTSSDF